MKMSNGISRYFPSNVHLTRMMWERLDLDHVLAGMRGGRRVPEIVFIRQIADSFNRLPDRNVNPVPAGQINLYGLQGKIFRYIIDRYFSQQPPGTLAATVQKAGHPFSSPATITTLVHLADIFPGSEILTDAVTPSGFVARDVESATRKTILVRELLLLVLGRENPAVTPFRVLFDHADLASDASLGRVAAAIEAQLAALPPVAPIGLTLPHLLRAPLRASPHSLSGQIDYIRDRWRELLPPELLTELLTSLDIAKEEEREWWGGPGRPQVLEFKTAGQDVADYDRRFSDSYPEHERFSADADWMANVVMIAKMTYVWLGQLSRKYSHEIVRLDQVPDEELDLLARWGFTALWLIGLWERSPASGKIKQIGGNAEAISSAYSLYDYTIAADLGGDAALANLEKRCAQRGIRLASDMVPNHTGLYSRWTVEHPDWFIQLDYPPYPDYNFSGPDLSFSPDVSLNIEDGYWDRSNAAVVFKHYDHRSGRTRYIYHGNDGTSTPWNDTAQLNYLMAEVREAVIQTILHVARQFRIIRFDAAMTLAKKHYQRLWFPQPGHGSGVPSRAEHGMSREAFDAAFPEEFWREVVDRVAAEVPDTLLLAEAFWLMEGYFVRTLGMHRVYNSAFMNMMKMEENAKYRQTLKNVLEYDHRILQRFVNFMNNPDERTAVEQFGKEGKYFGAALLLVTMPGLPMFGHGQIEGFHEKYGMEYKRAYWDEPVDDHLVRTHEHRIFPLMRRRWLFSGSAEFVLYDFYSGENVNEDVFAFSNRVGEARGIVLFHNRYATVSGWIRTSAAMAVKNESGENVLVSKTLGEALGFVADGRYYYAFRDCITGLEYIRSGMELCEQGLHAELSAYRYHAFIDFREIVDDEYGTWGKLCHSLQGWPVENLDEELKQVRHAGVIDSFKAALRRMAPLLGVPELHDAERQECAALLETLYEEINNNTLCTGDSRVLAAEAVREVEGARHMRKLAERAVEEEVDDLFLMAYLVLHLAGKLAVDKDFPPVSAAWFVELGLDRAFSDLARGEEEMEPAEAALLLRLILRWQEFFTDWQPETASARFTILFADPAARNFLGVHTYQQIEWFAKEQFELFIGRLVSVEEVGVAAETVDQESIRSLLDVLRKEIHYLKAVAAEAGYRVDRFLALLKVSDASPGASEGH